MIITVFGTGTPTERGYNEAYELGKKIAQAGHTLKNGGYGGTMEASAKGCREHGGKVIGVCIKGHPFTDAGKPNDFLSEVILKDNLTERTKELLETDCILVLPGKIGTLEELFKAWAEVYIKKEGKVYLLGEKNKKLLNFLVDEGFIDAEHRIHVETVESSDEIEFLKPTTFDKN